MRAEPCVTPSGELCQRHGVLRATACGVDPLAIAACSLHLRYEQLREVARVKCIARLVASSLKTDVAQRSVSQMRVLPGESADASDENFHLTVAASRSVQLTAISRKMLLSGLVMSQAG